jgi:hypothetical protein
VFSTKTLCSLLYALFSIDIIILQLYNEGVYIPFPSSTLKLSNLSIKFYLPTFVTHKGSYILWMRVDRSRSFYNNTSMPPLNEFIIISKHFQKMCSVLFQLSLISTLSRYWLCLHTLVMLLHHTPSLEKFHGILSMSSRTVCPCF